MFESSLNLPSQIRVSLGTAMLLGLLKECKMEVPPTTAYLMTYAEGKCTANCSFCSQAKDSKSRAEMLSRVTWPSFPTVRLIEALGRAIEEGKIRRVCIQALNVPGVFLDLEALVREIKQCQMVNVSVSCQPLNRQNIQCLRDAGVDRIGIALDAVSERIFGKVKGVEAGSVYSWRQEHSLLEEAGLIFGADRVSTHLIIGLGETEKEASAAIQWCVDRGVLPALFAFTPIEGTMLEHQPQPNIATYRRLQLVRYLLVHGAVRLEHLKFDTDGRIIFFGAKHEELQNIVNGGIPFQTSGCPDCNRPYYNEKIRGPLYNYPKKLNIKEVEEIKRQLGLS